MMIIEVIFIYYCSIFFLQLTIGKVKTSLTFKKESGMVIPDSFQSVIL